MNVEGICITSQNGNDGWGSAWGGGISSGSNIETLVPARAESAQADHAKWWPERSHCPCYHRTGRAVRMVGLLHSAERFDRSRAAA